MRKHIYILFFLIISRRISFFVHNGCLEAFRAPTKCVFFLHTRLVVVVWIYSMTKLDGLVAPGPGYSYQPVHSISDKFMEDLIKLLPLYCPWMFSNSLTALDTNYSALAFNEAKQLFGDCQNILTITHIRYIKKIYTKQTLLVFLLTFQ